MFLFVSYCSNVFWPQFLGIFMEFPSFSICAVWVSVYLAECTILKMKVIYCPTIYKCPYNGI
jgi:hypothetical protein